MEDLGVHGEGRGSIGYRDPSTHIDRMQYDVDVRAKGSREREGREGAGGHRQCHSSFVLIGHT